MYKSWGRCLLFLPAAGLCETRLASRAKGRDRRLPITGTGGRTRQIGTERDQRRLEPDGVAAAGRRAAGGIASAIPIIAGWKRTPRATGLAELAPLAENLKTLRTTLSCDGSEPAEVRRLLNVLGDQVRVVAATQRGIPSATEPAAERWGVILAGQARS